MYLTIAIQVVFGLGLMKSSNDELRHFGRFLYILPEVYFIYFTNNIA